MTRALSRLRLRHAASVALLVTVLSGSAPAQDRRQVAEPRIPAACTNLTAALQADKGRSIAESDESRQDTGRIQKAIDACPAGRAVELSAGGAQNAFLSGPLHLKSGITLVVDAGTFLFGSRNPRDYDVSPGSCGVVNHDGRGCKPLISAEHAADAGVMGDGVIDGRGWAKLLGAGSSWWELAEAARGDDLRQNCPRLMQLNYANNFSLYRITLKNSPNFHVAYSGGSGFTAWGVIIATPRHARNTDGIDPISATDVTITHSYIHAGDDNVAIKAGNLGPSTHITVAHNHFYTGHGISIGSETQGGVGAVRVTDLSIDGADNGIRIKSNSSRGGLVEDVVYQDVCIRDTRNPILMDTHYSFYGSERNRLPIFTGIVLENVRVLTAGKITLQGYDRSHRLGIRFDGVTLPAGAAANILASHAQIELGPGPVNFIPRGEDVNVTGRARAGEPYSCETRFVAMPEK